MAEDERALSPARDPAPTAASSKASYVPSSGGTRYGSDHRVFTCVPSVQSLKSGKGKGAWRTAAFELRGDITHVIEDFTAGQGLATVRPARRGAVAP